MMSVTAISPIDGRYEAQTQALAADFSEWALIRNRVRVEVEWLLFMSEQAEIDAVRSLTEAERRRLHAIVTDFDPVQAERVKEIEQTTRHDVKAVEYYLKEQIRETSLTDVQEMVHFCCTSEDINNLAYGLMLKHGITATWQPQAQTLIARVTTLAAANAAVPMLSRTHGQPASPTTVGKELAVFVHRWQRQLAQVDALEYRGKFNGTVGNFHTHSIAYPNADWEALSEAFVTRLGLIFNPLTTQIESHDYIAELAHAVARFNTITLGFDQDIWTYISLGYFRQRVVAHEVGSSTMPHKVNPINFENSESNLGTSNALLMHLAAKLPISRMQRDLTDSSSLRNLGTAIAHSSVALQATVRGLNLLEVDTLKMQADLEAAWEVLAEPVQTIMRRVGFANAYERLKELTRGAGISRDALQAFIADLDLPEDDKQRLLALTPHTYVGLAPELVRHIRKP